MKKRFISMMMVVAMSVSLAAGCGSASSSESAKTPSSEESSETQSFESSGSTSDSESDTSGVTLASSSDIDSSTEKSFIQQISEAFSENYGDSDKYTGTDSEATSASAVGMEKLPDDYLNDEKVNYAEHQGTIEQIDYQRELTTASGDALYCTANVYLPYGYDENEQYDIIYLMHGMGGDQNTFLGNAVMEGGIKVILDNMIEEGKIPPVIVVAPGLEESGDVDLENQVIWELIDSIANYLMPLVETQYSTYAETADEAGFIASRDHRCFGGFSMGGCATWQMLWYYPGYFRYYIPNSMIADFRLDADVEGTTEKMVNSITEKGYSMDDFEIYCGVGTEDYTNFMVSKQIDALLEYSDLFKDTEEDGFDSGNLMYRKWSGRYHRFYESFPYFYNALQLFFGE